MYPGMYFRGTTVEDNSLYNISGERWKDQYSYNTERPVNYINIDLFNQISIYHSSVSVQVNESIRQFLVNFFAKIQSGKVSAVCRATETRKSEYIGRISLARHGSD